MILDVFISENVINKRECFAHDHLLRHSDASARGDLLPERRQRKPSEKTEDLLTGGAKPREERGMGEGLGGDRTSAEELTVHPFFSVPTAFPRVERAADTSIRHQTLEDEVERKNKKKRRRKK